MSPFSVLKEQSLQTTAKKFFYSLLKLKPKSKTLEDNLLLKKKKATILQIPKADY